jgi:two-component system response regulator FixJ
MSPDRLVCIVDDDEAVRDSTCMLLESHDIPTRAFASAGTFLDAFEPTRTACVILDLHMPQMSGAELLELLRGRGVATPVIVVSGRRDPVLDLQIRRAGALAILSKPADDAELLKLVEAAIS